MEASKLLIELLKVIIWPMVVIYAIHKFGGHILKLIPKLREVRVAGAEFRWDKVEAQIEAKIEEVIDKPFDDDTQKNENGRVYQLKTDDTVMLAFATGKSWNENIQYDIYYDPVSRNNNTPFTFLGLYRGQAIEYVGKITKIFCCDYVEGKLVPTNGNTLDMLTTDEYQRVKKTIEDAHYDIEYQHKFYLVDKFVETRFLKSSPGGIMSKKYFWLDNIEGFTKGMSAQQVASLLNGKSWE